MRAVELPRAETGCAYAGRMIAIPNTQRLHRLAGVLPMFIAGVLPMLSPEVLPIFSTSHTHDC